MTLHEILVEIARIAGRSPPRIRLPNAALLPIAYAAEAVGRLTGRTTRVTVEPVRMARKRMFFSSEKAVRELGYRWRAPAKAFEDAVLWLREQELLQQRTILRRVVAVHRREHFGTYSRFHGRRQKPTLAGESAAGMQGRCAEGEIRKIDTNRRTLAVRGRRSAQRISFWWRGKDTGKMPAIRHWAGCIHFLCHARTVRAPRRPRSYASMGRSSGTRSGEAAAAQPDYAQPSDYRAPGVRNCRSRRVHAGQLRVDESRRCAASRVEFSGPHRR